MRALTFESWCFSSLGSQIPQEKGSRMAAATSSARNGAGSARNGAGSARNGTGSARNGTGKGIQPAEVPLRDLTGKADQQGRDALEGYALVEKEAGEETPPVWPESSGHADSEGGTAETPEGAWRGTRGGMRGVGEGLKVAMSTVAVEIDEHEVAVAVELEADAMPADVIAVVLDNQRVQDSRRYVWIGQHDRQCTHQCWCGIASVFVNPVASAWGIFLDCSDCTAGDLPDEYNDNVPLVNPHHSSVRDPAKMSEEHQRAGGDSPAVEIGNQAVLRGFAFAGLDLCFDVYGAVITKQ
eukprot:4859961-Pyramimonas_sp.AAC.1